MGVRGGLAGMLTPILGGVLPWGCIAAPQPLAGVSRSGSSCPRLRVIPRSSRVICLVMKSARLAGAPRLRCSLAGCRLLCPEPWPNAGAVALEGWEPPAAGVSAGVSPCSGGHRPSAPET